MLSLDKIINVKHLVTKFMTQKIFFYLLLIGGLCTFSCVDAATPAKTSKVNNNEQSLDRIVAIVNETPITETELNEAINTIKKQTQPGTLPSEAALRKQVLDQVINRKLQLELANENNFKISDEQVTKAIEGIAKQNKVSLKDLMRKVTDTGMTEKTYRKEIYEEMLIQSVEQSQVGSKITITPQETDDFMRSATWKAFNNKEYHLEDILISVPEAPTPQDLAAAKIKAESVIEKLHKGMSFKELAMADSGSSGALQGGDLGWRKLPQIPSQFADQLVHMKDKDIIGPVLTPNGYHVVRLAGTRETHHTMSADAARKQVEQLIFQRKLEEALQSWLTRIRSEAFINMNPEKA
jgi:peptidyl-prolyl cis-trans isomerase SurA